MTDAPQPPIPASTQPATPAAPVAPGKNTKATVGMILGIITVTICWAPFFIPLVLQEPSVILFLFLLPLGTGIAGLILSALGRRTAKANGVGADKATVGLILGIVGLALTLVFLLRGLIVAWMEMSRWSGELWERAKQGGPGEFDPSQF